MFVIQQLIRRFEGKESVWEGGEERKWGERMGGRSKEGGEEEEGNQRKEQQPDRRRAEEEDERGNGNN